MGKMIATVGALEKVLGVIRKYTNTKWDQGTEVTLAAALRFLEETTEWKQNLGTIDGNEEQNGETFLEHNAIEKLLYEKVSKART